MKQYEQMESLRSISLSYRALEEAKEKIDKHIGRGSKLKSPEEIKENLEDEDDFELPPDVDDPSAVSKM